MRPTSLLLCLLLSPSALAVPMQLSHTGRLFDAAGLPVDASHDVDVGLYSGPSTASPLWSDTIAGVPFDNGYFSIELGQDTVAAPLDDAIFDNDVLWISLGLDGGGEIGSRLQLRSVPFARRAGTATNLSGGTVDASEISIAGNVVIDSSGAISSSGTLGGLGACSADDVPTFNGTAWACGAPGADWSTISNVPTELLDGDADTLAGLSCADGEVAAWSLGASSWRCVVPYGDSDAVNAMGTLGDGNTLNHSRYTDAEALAIVGSHYNDSDATAAMGALGDGNPLNHDRYSDAEATAAMGTLGDANALNHTRYSDGVATAAMGPIDNANTLNHARYSDGDATAAMGAIGNANPFNHDRYSDAEASAAARSLGAFSGADFATSAQSCPSGETATGIDASGALTCTAPALALADLITNSLTVSAAGACGGVGGPEHMQVFVNGQLVGETDLTNTSYADFTYPLSTGTAVHTVSTAFSNNSSGGGCDHNLNVEGITLDTSGVSVLSTDRRVLYDVNNFWDSAEVIPGQAVMPWNGALHFRLAAAHDSRTRLLGNVHFNTQTNVPCCGSWYVVGGSSITATTSGGPLLFNTNLSMTGGSHSTCQLRVDGVWAGTYSGQTDYGNPYWNAGLQYTADGWRPWAVSRVFTGIPAGTHTFTIACANDSGTSQVNNGSSVGSSFNVIEL